MNSVGKAAMDMVYEVSSVQRNPGIMEGTGKPYAKCVDISKQLLREMMLPNNVLTAIAYCIGGFIYDDNNQ
jgi:Na+/H+-translocating membrane pyrophosphatase